VIIPSDDDLIKGCRKGQRQSQNLLFEKFRRKVFGICKRYASSYEEAKDIQQESFIKAFGFIEKNNQDIQSLGQWMSRITVNAAIDYIRKKHKLHETPCTEDEDNLLVMPEVLDRLHEEDLIALIQTIPNPYRAVFNLYIIDGYAHQEIGYLLGINESTSRSFLSRAKASLRRTVRSQYTEIKVNRYG
jgi:RNA polymerase sigma factor (sigma-70 family)